MPAEVTKQATLTALLARVSQGDFEVEDVLREYSGLPGTDQPTFLSEVLDALRGKMTILNLASFLAPKLELASLIQDVVFKISEILDCERSTLMIADRERQELWSKVAQGLEIQEIRIPMTAGIAGHVAATRETLIIEDAYKHALFNPEVDRQTGYRTRTMLCAPIVSIKKDLIGVVQAINKRQGQFDPGDVQMLQGITSILALLLENSLLYEKVMHGQRQVSSLLKVANALTAQLDLTTLIQTIMSKASEIMNADRASLFLIDRETGELYSRVAQGLDVAEIRLPKSRGLAGHVATTGATLNIPDAYQNPLFNRETDRKTGYRTRNVLCMPIRDHAGDVTGVTQVINKRGGTFDRSDEELLGAFSAQASIAIENAQLYERTMNLKNYLESILRSLSNGVVAVDPRGTITLANTAAARIFDLPETGMQGRPVAEVFAANPTLVERVARIQGADTVYTEYDAAFTTAAGRGVTVNLTALPLFDVKRRKIGVIVIVEDVTSEKRIKSNLTRYMSKEIVDRVLSEDSQHALGGVRQEVSVLFSDIRSFTTLTEGSTAHEIVAMLNEYFSQMVDAVFKYRGVLDKFIGDAVMAVFGAPLPLPDHAYLACQTALEMRRLLAILNVKRISEDKLPIKIGIGISTGEVLCGNIGSEKRMEYTAIGDGVNLASRLEGANKIYGTDIMISEFTYQHVKDQVFVRELDCIQVKGKTEPVRVFEVLSLIGEELAGSKQTLLDRYVDGVARYRERRFLEAVASFEKALAIDDTDTPSRLYAERCRFFAATPPGPEWNGVWKLTEK
jgi:adenylate cyclase